MGFALFGKIHDCLAHRILGEVFLDVFLHHKSNMTISCASHQGHGHKLNLATKCIYYLVSPSHIVFKLKAKLC